MNATLKRTNSSMAIRYAVMSVGASAVPYSVIFGQLKNYVSYDRQAVLIIMFNIIAVMGRTIVSVFADRVKNKHTGVRLSVLFTVMGLYYPVAFGINAKVILLAIGSCIFHSFASSSLLSRSNGKARDIGLFVAGNALGTALGIFADFFGYVTAALMMIFAIPDDRDTDLEIVNEPDQAKVKTKSRLIFIPLLMLSYALLYLLLASLHFPFNSFFKTECLLFISIAIGRALGGFVSDLIGKTMTVCCGMGGGSLILFFCSDNKILSMVGLALVSLSLAPIISLSTKYLQRHPGFVFALLSAASYFGQCLSYFIKLDVLLVLIGFAVIALVFTSELPFLVKEVIVTEDNDEEDS